MIRIPVFLIALALMIGAGPKSQAAPRVHVLMIGDSLTVGAFGERMHSYLASRFGSSSVAVFGSCGSAPQHWLRSEPEFDTKCGYREQIPGRNLLLDFNHGRPPPHVRTPKLENLLDRYGPRVVLIQLGTNWMDDAAPGDPKRAAKRHDILERMAAALEGGPGTVRQVIWITPPDSIHFSKRVQATVQGEIVRWARVHGFQCVLSSRMTHYIRGKTGGDGIHYNEVAGAAWARSVGRELDSEML